jgi:transposase
MVYPWDMRPQGTPQQLHKRRVHAIKLLQAGKIPAVVARALSASRSSVTRWQQAFKQKGGAGLHAKPIPGRPPRLSAKQKLRLEQYLLEGPLAAGYKTDLWTLRRITRLIKKHFHVTYHPGHVWKILRALGWSCQKPERRATQRDEAVIAHWKRYVWPQIRRQADRLGAHLIFLDESGFLLIPHVKRTWAPTGQTPTIRYCFKHSKISAISALAVSPKRKHLALFLQFRRRSFKGPDVKRFLQDLLKHVHGPIILLWDGGRIHRHHEVKTWCEAHPRLQVEEFPGYAPELNPAEYVWCQSDSALANSMPEELDELKTMLVATKRRLLRSQDLLWSCIYASDLPWK